MLSIDISGIFDNFFAGICKAYDTVWITGDVFVVHTYDQYFENIRGLL